MYRRCENGTWLLRGERSWAHWARPRELSDSFAARRIEMLAEEDDAADCLANDVARLGAGAFRLQGNDHRLEGLGHFEEDFPQFAAVYPVAFAWHWIHGPSLSPGAVTETGAVRLRHGDK